MIAKFLQFLPELQQRSSIVADVVLETSAIIDDQISLLQFGLELKNFAIRVHVVQTRFGETTYMYMYI